MPDEPTPDQLQATIASLRAEVAELKSRLANEVVYLQGEKKAERGLRSLSGDSAAMKAVRQATSQSASTEWTVLFLFGCGLVLGRVGPLDVAQGVAFVFGDD